MTSERYGYGFWARVPGRSAADAVVDHDAQVPEWLGRLRGLGREDRCRHETSRPTVIQPARRRRRPRQNGAAKASSRSRASSSGGRGCSSLTAARGRGPSCESAGARPNCPRRLWVWPSAPRRPADQRASARRSGSRRRASACRRWGAGLVPMRPGTARRPALFSEGHVGLAAARRGERPRIGPAIVIVPAPRRSGLSGRARGRGRPRARGRAPAAAACAGSTAPRMTTPLVDEAADVDLCGNHDAAVPGPDAPGGRQSIHAPRRGRRRPPARRVSWGVSSRRATELHVAALEVQKRGEAYYQPAPARSASSPWPGCATWAAVTRAAPRRPRAASSCLRPSIRDRSGSFLS